MSNCGCEGSCPVCHVGEVDDHKCNHCGAEFCPKCHGIKNDVKSTNALPCKCKSNQTDTIKECLLIKAEVRSLQDTFPTMMVIVIAPSEKEAKEQVEQELKPYPFDYPYRLGLETLGLILFSPVPKTIFLYTQEAGRIK